MKFRPALIPAATLVALVALPGARILDSAEIDAPDTLRRVAFADTLATLYGNVVFAPHRRAAPSTAVIVIGTRRGALADDEGRFTITKVRPGVHSLRIASAGSRPATREFTIVAGRNDLGEFVLDAPDVHLDLAPVAIGSRAGVGPRDLEATIRPAQRRVVVGDTPTFEVRIRNRGKAPVLLPQSVDASDAWASPRVNIEIAGPESGLVVPLLIRCGNNNGIGREDFAEVAPGGEFDPYAGGWISGKVRRARFAKPGRYTAKFRYVTTETNPRLWMGGPCDGCMMSGSLRDLLEQVPAVELTATTTFEVVP